MKLMLLMCLFVLSACNNLVFYQAQRVSVTLEASPQDVTKPIQANIGSKTRTFIIAPQTQKTDTDNAELVSMLGYGAATLLDYGKGTKAPANTAAGLVDGNQQITAQMGMEQMTFKTAFVSGQAAKDLARNQTEAQPTGTTGQTGQQLLQGPSDKKLTTQTPASNIAGALGQHMTEVKQ